MKKLWKKTVLELVMLTSDNMFLTNVLLFMIVLAFVFKISPVTIGGILLILGAWYVYIGNIFYSVMNYTIADACWLINAYQNGDLIGTITVTIGIIVGLIVTNKMRIGKFRKSIRKD